MENLSTLISLLLMLLAIQIQTEKIYADNQFESERIISSGCLEKTNITLEKALSYTVQEAEDNPRLQCLISCFLEHAGIIKDCELIVEDETWEDIYEKYEACVIATESREPCNCGLQWEKCFDEILEN